MSTKTLTAAEIFAADDTQVVPVAVPEWGGTVHVRSLTAEERDRYDESIYGDDEKVDRKRWRAKLVLAAACDAQGKPLFQAGDLERLAKKANAPVTRVYLAAARLNGIGAAEVEAKKNDSPGDQTAGSPSGSPSPPAA